jgi:hypothetical protein
MWEVNIGSHWSQLKKNQDPIQKNNKSKKDLGHGSGDRALAYQALTLSSNPSTTEQTNKWLSKKLYSLEEK